MGLVFERPVVERQGSRGHIGYDELKRGLKKGALTSWPMLACGHHDADGNVPFASMSRLGPVHMIRAGTLRTVGA